MKLRLIVQGFLHMLPPLESKRVTDERAAAALARMRDDQRWREYDRPAWLRMNRHINLKEHGSPTIEPQPSNVVQLSSFLRRQAE